MGHKGGKPGLSAALAAQLLDLWPTTAPAPLGPFEHSHGIKAMGRGSVGYARGGDTTTPGGNPAHAFAMGQRFDRRGDERERTTRLRCDPGERGST